MRVVFLQALGWMAEAHWQQECLGPAPNESKLLF